MEEGVVKEYRVVQSYDMVLFLRDVNKEATEGWKPQGGVHTDRKSVV